PHESAAAVVLPPAAAAPSSAAPTQREGATTDELLSDLMTRCAEIGLPTTFLVGVDPAAGLLRGELISASPAARELDYALGVSVGRFTIELADRFNAIARACREGRIVTSMTLDEVIHPLRDADGAATLERLVQGGRTTILPISVSGDVVGLALPIVGLAGGFWGLALLHSSRAPDRRSPFSIAIPVALVVDLVARAAFGTVPIVDRPLAVAGPGVLIVALVFLAAGLAALSGERAWTRPGAAGTLALIALPVVLFVAETGGTNGAQTALAGGLGLGPDSVRSTELGLVIVGLGLALGTLALAQPLPAGILAAVACAGGAALLWAHIPVASLAGGFVLAGGVVLAGASLPAASLAPSRTPIVVSFALAVGWLLFLA